MPKPGERVWERFIFDVKFSSKNDAKQIYFIYLF